MRRMLYYTAVTVMLLFILLLAGAVFRDGRTHSFEAEEKTRLSVTASIVHERQKEAFNLIISNEISDDAEFSVRYFATDNYAQKIAVDLSSGTYSDIIIIPSSALNDKLLSNRHIVRVGSIMSDSVLEELNISRSFFARLQDGGSLRGIPYDIFAAGVFCNKSIFEKYDLTFPKNYDELKKTVTVLKENGVIPFAVNLNGAGTYLFDYIITDIAGETDENISYEDYQRIIEVVDELKRLGAFPEDFSSLNDYDARSLFIEGKAAMIVEDTSFCLSISELYNVLQDSKQSVEVEYFPSIGTRIGNERRLLYDIGNYVILFTDNIIENSEKTKAAVDFVNHIFNYDTADAFCTETYSITTIKTARPHSYSSPQMLDFFGLIDQSQLYVSPLKENYGKINKSVFLEIFKKKYKYGVDADELWEGI